MPELPEVETVARGVNARVRGERIAEVWFGEKPEPLKSPAMAMERALTGARILGVRRVGKTIVVDLVDGGAGKQKRIAANRDKSKIQNQWLVHLGMTGRLLVNAPEVPRAKHTHAVLTLESGQELRFVDPRRFGRLSLAEMGAAEPAGDSEKSGGKKKLAGSVAKAKRGGDNPLAVGYRGPGVEPMTVGMEEFAGLFRGRKTPIKSALLNQKLLQGVGNIYADEALFRAGVRPLRKANRLTRVELERLRVGMVEVLRQAIALGGSSVSDYVDADGAAGFFQLEHRVYGRTGEACRVCGTPIKRVVIGGRSSHYCPSCQK
jgi:formamidopyrimidine-DNA glycosylase